ncbi:MAG: hypothetical protein KF841_14475 [Phycisphaerae bacterium]|nr:hypothetical protein [Phycisphaerae bacterium]
MERIAIDVGPEFVSLCRADHHAIRAVERHPYRHPREAWLDWVRRLNLSDRHEAVFRCTHPACMNDCTSEAVESWARSVGARWIRRIGGDRREDPSLAVTRFLAGRTRWVFILSLSLSGRLATAAVQDRRGAVLACDQSMLDQNAIAAGAHGLSQLCHSVVNSAATSSTQFSLDRTGLIAIGDSAEAWAPIVSRELRLPEPHVPPQPASWPAIGMLLAPIRLDFTAVREPDASADLAELRREFAALMDAACDGITREGFDLDDTDCARFIRIESPGLGGPPTVVEIGFDELPYGRGQGLACLQKDARVTGLRVSATIHPPCPDWPLDVAPPLVNRC